MIRVGIIGARGYTGEELIKILLKHPQARLTYLAATLDTPTDISEFFPRLKGLSSLKCETFSLDNAVSRCDLLFLALPHTASMEIAPKLITAKKKIIDLSADYRFKNVKLYERWYHKEHSDKENLKKFIYGLPELYRQKIKGAECVANPGCYPTASILAAMPVLACGLAEEKAIIIDAKSGVTGAGRKLAQEYLYPEVNENFKGYKFNNHQHSPEIEQGLSGISSSKVSVIFCPHLLPINRGLLATLYIRLKKATSQARIADVYRKFYRQEPFIRVDGSGGLPELKNVVGTNFCDIGFVADVRNKILIIVAVIDNLLKGASGQAVENMNLMCGFPETEALL